MILLFNREYPTVTLIIHINHHHPHFLHMHRCITVEETKQLWWDDSHSHPRSRIPGNVCADIIRRAMLCRCMDCEQHITIYRHSVKMIDSTVGKHYSDIFTWSRHRQIRHFPMRRYLTTTKYTNHTVLHLVIIDISCCYIDNSKVIGVFLEYKWRFVRQTLDIMELINISVP